MDLFKKIVITYYILLTTAVLVVVLLDGYGTIKFSQGNITHIITLFSVAICPVVITAIRAKEFWKDDPSSVAQKDKDISKMKLDHLTEKSSLLLQNQKVVDQLKKANSELEKELARRPKPLKRKAPKPISRI